MKKTIMVTALMALAVSTSAQEEKTLESYHYFEAQGGVQMTTTNEDMSKLISPTVAFSYGYMTPNVGFRLHLNGWQSKLNADNKFKYIDVNGDLLLNVTSFFSRNISRPLNLYLRQFGIRNSKTA